VAGLPRYEQRALLRTWVFRIARNLCLKYQRRRPLPPHAARDEPTPSPEAQYEAREDHEHAAHQHRLLDRCLRRLPARERDLLMLYYYEELSFRAMAKRLWRPEATVRRAVHQAEHRLREYMTQKEGV
jgi:RNA polymerase sigma-70 factor (ECF subfamily)